MQAAIISLKQVRHHREQVKEARRLAQIIANADIVARLTEYVALVEQLEHQAKALRETTTRTMVLGAELKDLCEAEKLSRQQAANDGVSTMRFEAQLFGREGG